MNADTVGCQLLNTWSGRVHSVFENAANISTGSGLATFLFNRLWASETAIILPDKSILSMLNRGTAVHSDGKQIFINDKPLVDLFHAEIWRMPELKYSPLSEERLKEVSAFLDRSEGGIVDKIFLDCIENGEFEKIIGAGAGLTPSGDDMLTGYALALLYCAPEKLEMLAEKCTPLISHTTDISRHLLAQAFKGKFAAPILGLLLALKDGENVEKAIINAAAIGSSSGRDGVFGLYWGIRLHEQP